MRETKNNPHEIHFYSTLHPPLEAVKNPTIKMNHQRMNLKSSSSVEGRFREQASRPFSINPTEGCCECRAPGNAGGQSGKKQRDLEEVPRRRFTRRDSNSTQNPIFPEFARNSQGMPRGAILRRIVAALRGWIGGGSRGLLEDQAIQSVVRTMRYKQAEGVHGVEEVWKSRWPASFKRTTKDLEQKYVGKALENEQKRRKRPSKQFYSSSAFERPSLRSMLLACNACTDGKEVIDNGDRYRDIFSRQKQFSIRASCYQRDKSVYLTIGVIVL